MINYITLKLQRHGPLEKASEMCFVPCESLVYHLRKKSKWPLQIKVCFCLLSYSRCVTPVLVHSDCLPRKSERRMDSTGLISGDSPSTLTLTHCSKFCPNTSRCKPSEDHPLDEPPPSLYPSIISGLELIDFLSPASLCRRARE